MRTATRTRPARVSRGHGNPHARILANSAGVALGATSFDLTAPAFSLRRVPRRNSPITTGCHPRKRSSRRGIEAGGGYNATPAFRCIGVVSLGYADGILRSWGGAHFTHGERRLPILGKVSMDMIVLDLSAAPELAEGDWLDLPYRLPDAAQQTTLSQYELLTVLGNRFG